MPPSSKDGKPTQGMYLIGLRSSKVIIFGGSFCGHLPSDPGDVEQEIPKQLNRAEPEEDAKNRVAKPGAVSGPKRALGTKDAGRSVPEIFMVVIVE